MKYNVIIYNPNRKVFEQYDILPYFKKCYEDLKSINKEPKSYYDFKEFISNESKYQFWGRCEYEIVLYSWPNNDIEEKIDVHYQIMQNIDIVTKIFIEYIL